MIILHEIEIEAGLLLEVPAIETLIEETALIAENLWLEYFDVRDICFDDFH